MSEQPSPTPVREVRTDLICRRCGYNLRALAVDGNCPECGAAIEWSIKGWRLCYANPRWLGQLRRGGNALFWASVLMLGLVVMAFASLLPYQYHVLYLPLTLCASAVLVLLLRAIWLLTTPEPFVDGDVSPVNTRRIARVLGTAALLFSLLALLRHLLPLVLILTLDELTPFGWPGWLALVTPFGGLFLLLQHLQSIAARLPESYVGQGMKSFVFAMAITTLILIVTFILFATAGGEWGLVLVFLCGLPIVIVIFGIWFAILAGELSSALSHAAATSRGANVGSDSA